MKNFLKAFAAILFVGVLALALGIPARAQTPHYPTADTYTDTNNRDVNHGGDLTLILAGTNNGTTCTETTYLWYKFNVPNTAQTITTATFYLELAPAGNSNPLALELRSSSDILWTEGGLTWNTQPALDATVLATSPSVARGGTVAFTGATFATYLNTHKGQTITLVVRADCDGLVGFPGNRVVTTKENVLGSAATIEMFGPTAVDVLDLSASTQPAMSITTLALVAALVAVPTLAWAGTQVIRRRRNP